MMRVAVTGRHGQVARSLIERGAAADVEIVNIARPEVDLASPDNVASVLFAIKPDAVVNAAAYTAVDAAESEPEMAHRVNCEGADAVARAAAGLSIPVIHLSTDYVFDGGLDRPYREDDHVNPVSVYGRTKLAGEQAVAAANPDHAILRTAWVYSPFGKNFVKTMLSLADKRDELGVVSDQHGTPTSALEIADAALAIARNLTANAEAKELRGVFHMTAEGHANWAEFAAAIFEYSKDWGGPTARVSPITTRDYPTPARRPANSRLDNSRLVRIHGVRMPHWRQSLRDCVERLLAQQK